MILHYMSRAAAFCSDCCSRLLALVDCLQFHTEACCSNQADSWWKLGQASERLSASVTGSSVVIGAAGRKQQRGRR